jgi:hypothetical protein
MAATSTKTWRYEIVETLTAHLYGPVAVLEKTSTSKAGAVTRKLVPASYVETMPSSPAEALDTVDKTHHLLLLTSAGRDELDQYGVAQTIYRDYWNNNKWGAEHIIPDTDWCDTLAAMSDDTIVRQAVELSYSDNSVWKLGAQDADGPLNVPVTMAISDRYVRINDARTHLEQHPNVLDVTFNAGRPGAYDHVPASLELLVRLDDDTWKSVAAKAAEEYARYITPGARPPGPNESTLERLYVWEIRNGRTRDLFGLLPYLRDDDEYQEPRC